MAEFISTTAQSVAQNGNVLFQSTVSQSGCVKHRNGSGLITVKGNQCGCGATYMVTFHANVTGVAGAIQLSICQDGEVLPETQMSVVPAASTDVWSVDAQTEVKTLCDCSTITVRNTSSSAIAVNNASIIIERE